MSQYILEPELVPKTCWFSNVRSQVSPADWDILRKEVYREANYVCELCGGRGTNHPVECHEVWEYQEEHKVQKLVRLIALCPNCHSVKHFGLARVRGREGAVESQLVSVNEISKAVARKLMSKAMTVWRRRSKITWALDLAYLNAKGIKYKLRSPK